MGNGRAAAEGIVEVQKTLREDGGRRPFAAHQSEFKAKYTTSRSEQHFRILGVGRLALLAETRGLRARSTGHSTRERLGGTWARQQERGRNFDWPR